MKYLLHIGISLAVLLSFGNPFVVHAATFACAEKLINITSARVEVKGVGIQDAALQLLPRATSQNPTPVPTYPYTKTDRGNDSTAFFFDLLKPATTYRVQVVRTDGQLLEEITSCEFSTKEEPATAAATQPTNTANNQQPPRSTTTNPTTTSSTTAQQTTVPKPAPKAATDTNSTSGSGGFLLDVKLQNPLKVNSIEDAIQFFMNTLLKIAIPFIVIFFIWAGFKFVVAQGKPDKVAEAKKMFWFTIIGTLLILGAWTITNAIIGTVNSIVN